MKLVRTVKFSPALFGVIPLINVLVLLLAFWLFSATFVLQPGIAVTLPYSSFTLGPQRDALIVSIAPGRPPPIYFRDEKVTLDELAQRLGDPAHKTRTLIVKADRSVPYDQVVQLMNRGLQLGYSIVLATGEENR